MRWPKSSTTNYGAEPVINENAVAEDYSTREKGPWIIRSRSSAVIAVDERSLASRDLFSTHETRGMMQTIAG